jgi:preprotein translocase subunit SecG
MGFILVIHVIVCMLLVITILMQAGRGGGLTESFQSAESMFGTQTNAFMVRVTTILAVTFLSTSMILAFNSSQVTESLMANKRLLATVPKPMAPTETAVPNKDVPVSPVTNATK